MRHKIVSRRVVLGIAFVTLCLGVCGFPWVRGALGTDDDLGPPALPSIDASVEPTRSGNNVFIEISARSAPVEVLVIMSPVPGPGPFVVLSMENAGPGTTVRYPFTVKGLRRRMGAQNDNMRDVSLARIALYARKKTDDDGRPYKLLSTHLLRLRDRK